MQVLLEDELLNFLQYGSTQAAMTLKSRAVRSLNMIVCPNSVLFESTWMPTFFGLWELLSCILTSQESFNFVKKLYFRFTALSRAVVNLSVIPVGWSEVKVSSSLSQGLDQMTSWGVFQPTLFYDYAARQDACSMVAAQ